MKKISREEINNLLFSEDGLNTISFYDGVEISDSPAELKAKNLKHKKTSIKDVEKYADLFICSPTDKNFNNLWESAYWGIRQHAFKVLNNNDACDDVIANVFEKVLTKYKQFDRTKGKFTTWLFKICWNECLAYLNKQKKEALVDNDIEDLYPSFQIDQMSDRFAETFDYSDKFETLPGGEVRMLSREEIKKKFLDTSISEIEQFKDERVMICMKERFTFYRRGDEIQKRNLTLEEIAKKYNYPLTSVKNWVNKGKNDLKDAMLTKHKELYEMWKETLDD